MVTKVFNIQPIIFHQYYLWFKFCDRNSSFRVLCAPLRSVRSVHLHARADAASINQALLKRSRWKHLSSRDQWNLTPATMCRGSAARTVWSRRFGAAQTMHSHNCDHVKFLLSHAQKMFCSQSRALYYMKMKVFFDFACMSTCCWRLPKPKYEPS